MRVETTRFGTLEVDDNTLISMPRGLIGFEGCTRFALLEHRAGGNFRWLQSVEEPGLAFVVVDPSKHFSDYEVEVSDCDATNLHLADEKDASVLVILTIRDNGKEVSANLAAPIIINLKEQLAAQIVIQNEGYSTQHSLVRTCAERPGAANVA